MSNPYEGYKVQNLINTYRSNPDMFNDDQLDELERLAEDSQVSFKRLEDNFSLTRAVQQAQSGFIEGLTTFDLVPKEPRNTGEAIFRQLGHLAGFAPAILKAPLSLFRRNAALRKIKGDSKLYKTIENGINTLDAMSVPMMFQRGTKNLIDSQLSKRGLETIDYLKKGAVPRAIGTEALGLGVASAISNIWKGSDVIADSFIGGAIAGGAFGGIGNFVSVGNLYKGTPQQVNQANKILRSSVASAFMGLPSTFRGDPTEMQMYEYLLGGFFGYNTRPARESAAGEWIMGSKKNGFTRDIRDIVDPEQSKDWNTIDKKAQDYILNEHPAPSFKNSERLEGATGSALGWLQHNYKNFNWRNAAIKHYEAIDSNWNTYSDKGKNTKIAEYYRWKAREGMTVDAFGKIANAVSTSEQLYAEMQSDFMDPFTKEKDSISKITEEVYKDVKKNEKDSVVYKDFDSFEKIIIDATNKSMGENGSNRRLESYIEDVKSNLDLETFKKHERNLRKKWWTETEPAQEVAFFIEGTGKNISVDFTKNEQINNISIGEKYDKMPLDYLGYAKGFRFLTHGVDKNGEPYKVLSHRMDGDGISFNVGREKLIKIEEALSEKGKYIFSGVKDKDFLLTADFVDNLQGVIVTKDMIKNAMANDPLEAKGIERAFKDGQLSESNVFGSDKNYERKWVSNILHHAMLNGLVNNQTTVRNLNLKNLLMHEGYGKSVADLNKRMTLLTNRMAPMQKASYVETNPDGLMRGIIVNDINTTGKSDTDGGLIIAHKFFDRTLNVLGFDPRAGHIKPVIAGQTGLSALFTKSNGQRASTEWNKFMESNGLDYVVFNSGAKLRGDLKSSELSIDSSTGKLSSNNTIVHTLPIEHLQVSTGTYENPVKSVKGDELPLQAYGQTNNVQAKGFAKEYISDVLDRSLAGSRAGQKLVEQYDSKKIEKFINLFETNELGVMELPMDFVSKILLKDPSTPLAKKFMDKLMRLETDGFLDLDFEFDSNSNYREFHASNKILAEAMAGTYAVRNILFRDNYHNALKKYLVKRYANPFIETAGKSWLKAYTPDQLINKIVDPALTKEQKKGINEGDLYLDNMFKRMLVEHKHIPKKDLEAIYQRKLINAQKNDSKATMETIDKRITLGEAWEQYLGGYTRKNLEAWNNTFDLIVIRTPADSMSGTRQLRFRGFTGQRGSGSFTHHKDNIYLGGADKDADSIKIFQGFNKNLRDYYVKVKDERSHWKEGGSYDKFINNLFRKEGMTDKERQRFTGYNKSPKDKEYNREDDVYNRMFMFSPAYRHKVAQNSIAGKGGLGYGLSAKIVMQNWRDFIANNKGSVEFPYQDLEKGSLTDYIAKVSLKKGTVEGQSRDQFFRDLGTAIVNKSADASTDPTVKAYPIFRQMLFNSLFKVESFDAKTGKKKESIDAKTGEVTQDYIGYKSILELAPFGDLAAIKDAVNIAKPASQVKNVSYRLIKDIALNNVSPQISKSLGLTVGERANYVKNNKTYSLIRLENVSKRMINQDKQSKNPKGLVLGNARYQSTPVAKSAMSLYDVGHGINNVQAKLYAKGADTVIPQIVKKMYNAGIQYDFLNFPTIQNNYKKLYSNAGIESQGLTGLTRYSTKEMSKFIEQHLGLLLSDLSIASPAQVTYAIGEQRNIGRALDYIGKSIGNFTTIELLNKNFIDIHKAFSNKGIKANVIEKVIPAIVKEVKDLKSRLSIDNRHKLDKDGIQLDVEADINGFNKRLIKNADAFGVSPKLFLDYYHNLLLSPITGQKAYAGSKFAKNTFYKDIHSSLAIPFATKKNFYQKMESMHERSAEIDTALLNNKPLTIKPSSKVNLEGVGVERKKPIKKEAAADKQPTKEDFLTINEMIGSDVIEKLAINDKQVEQVNQFRKNLNEHRVVKNNFEQWFEYFTSIIKGGIVPREATTFNMNDVIAVNRYFKGLQDPYNLEFKLKYWFLDPRFIDEKLSTKGLINKYFSYFGKVQTANNKQTFKTKPIFSFTSPIGEIAKYLQTSERYVSKDLKFAETKLFKPFERILKNFNVSEQSKLMEELFKYVEEGYKPTDVKTLRTLEKLDTARRNLFEGMQKWIYTYDAKGNKATNNQGEWVMDKDFLGWYQSTGGVLNKYMRWDKSGRMDLEHFRKSVIENGNINKKEVIDVVGTDGIKRYQKEHKLERLILNKPENNNFSYRHDIRKNYKGIGEINLNKYMPHLNFGYNEFSRKEIALYLEQKTNDIYDSTYKKAKGAGLSDKEAGKRAEKVSKEFVRANENKLMQAGEFFSYSELIEPAILTEADLKSSVSEQGSLASVLKSRDANFPGFDKRPEIVLDYINKVIRGYYKNAVSIKGQYEIDNMLNKNIKYKPSKAESKRLQDSIYKNDVQVWGDYIKLYLQSILGHQSYFQSGMLSGRDPLKLKDKRNLFYLTSDENVIGIFEKFYQKKNMSAPFFTHAPKGKEARKEYFSRKLHELGRMEAQYQLMSLLANTGTWATNVLSGNAMTAGSAGLNNLFSSYNNKQVYDLLLTSNGKDVIKLNNGKFAKNRKDLLKHLEEVGVLDAFIQNEFEINTQMTNSLKKAGVNVSNFKRDLILSIKDKANRKETPIEIINRYGVKDLMVKYGSFFMQNSERINRLNAFTAHALQTIKRFGVEGKELSIADPFVFDMAMKGIENTQFLYQNSARPAFMRTSVGKVLARFKLFVWNSIRTRKEYYRQAKLYGFKQNTPEYERFKNTYMIDMFMFALANAFMFSIFDTALAPPLDTVQSIADSMYGDKREKEMAFFGSKLGALNLLKPPVARIPEAAWELLTGDWEKFSSYTAYTMFPFGRGIRQLTQFADKPERAGEIFLRLPVNQIQSRIDRVKRRTEQFEDIQEVLGD